MGRISGAMVPIGKLIKDKLDERGLSAVWLADQIPCGRANVYKIFSKNSIDTELLLRICVVLEFDFFKYYSREVKE